MVLVGANYILGAQHDKILHTGSAIKADANFGPLYLKGAICSRLFRVMH